MGNGPSPQTISRHLNSNEAIVDLEHFIKLHAKDIDVVFKRNYDYTDIMKNDDIVENIDEKIKKYDKGIKTTLLLEASYFGRLKSVELLLKNNARKDIQYDAPILIYHKMTAKQIAEKKGFTDIVNLIEKYEKTKIAEEEKLRKTADDLERRKSEVKIRKESELLKSVTIKPIKDWTIEEVYYWINKISVETGYELPPDFLTIIFKERLSGIVLSLLTSEDLEKRFRMPFGLSKVLHAEIMKKNAIHLDIQHAVSQSQTDLTSLQKQKLESTDSHSKKKAKAKSMSYKSSTIIAEETNEGRGGEPLTARIHPGNRFLSLIPKAPYGKEDILKSLKEALPSSDKKDTNIIIHFEEKFEEYLSQGNIHEEVVVSMTLCWLYTLDSWVYKLMNEYLRNDSRLMESMAPIINGLIQSGRYLDPSFFFSGTVYRRSRLTEKAISFYSPGKTFIWSAFTSTTAEFSKKDIFGDILFQISIPDEKKQFALCLENVSQFPEEREILLLPNVGYQVLSIISGDEIDPLKFPKVKVIITLNVSFVCI